MPNLDFYAAGEDFPPILDYVFERSGCRVFENASAYDRELREFSSPAEVLGSYGRGAGGHGEPALYLQLVPPGADRLFRIRRIVLAPQSGGAFRQEIVGWGLIQLYLGGLARKGIVASHSNCNSLARARGWEGVIDGMGPVAAWKWREVRRISTNLGRFIRRRAVDRIASRPVLAEAARARATGAALLT